MLGWLRARPMATAEELAERFSVSLRTAHRDIAALRERGAPIQGDPGVGGGLRLDPMEHLPPVPLRHDELMGLIIAASLARRARAVPFGAAADAAVQRLVAALPDTRARELRRALDRVLVGPPASPAVAADQADVDDEVLSAFERAFTATRNLAFGYLDRHGRPSAREVEPHGLLLQPPACYLLAFDLDRDGPRMFRLDRIQRPISLLATRFTPRPLEVFQPLLTDVDAGQVE
jgi:predicted DNA-binding transcriptional regulator YafY